MEELRERVLATRCRMELSAHRLPTCSLCSTPPLEPNENGESVESAFRAQDLPTNRMALHGDIPFHAPDHPLPSFSIPPLRVAIDRENGIDTFVSLHVLSLSLYLCYNKFYF